MDWIHYFINKEGSCDGTILKTIENFPEGCIGFVYKLELDNGKFYIGRKELYSTTKRNFGKKEAALVTDKRKKKYEYVTKESNWKVYNGSNKQLLEDLKNGASILLREVITFAYNKKELTYFETKELICRGVLNDFTEQHCYNDNILGKFYRNDFKK